MSAEGALREVPASWLKHEVDKDFAWIGEHWEELKSKYPGKYIAVRRGRVIDFDEDKKRLRRRLEERFGDIWDIIITFIPAEEVKLLF